MCWLARADAWVVIVSTLILWLTSARDGGTSASVLCLVLPRGRA